MRHADHFVHRIIFPADGKREGDVSAHFGAGIALGHTLQ
jgi:hypothetical protein